MCSMDKLWRESSNLMSPSSLFRITLSYVPVLFLTLSWLACPVVCQGDYPPKLFSNHPIGSTIQEGVSKVLFCRSSSSPGPEYRWLKDGEYITNASQVGYSFRWDQIQRSDSGSYRCEASNILGKLLSSPAVMEVAYMENFTDFNKTFNLSVSEGNALVIQVPYVDSLPRPTLTWTENSVILNEESAQHHISLNGSLVLFDRQILQSNSIYVMEGLNVFTGELKKSPSYRVTVTADAAGSSRPLTFIIPPEDTIAKENDFKAEMECLVNASPVNDVQITWYRVINDSKTQIVESERYLLSNQRRRKLTIVSPKPEDTGQYQCEASLSGSDSIITATAVLTVNVAPTVDNHFQSEISRDFGQTVTLNCISSGQPKPAIHWYYNAKELVDGSSYTLFPNGSLMISQLDLEHAGMYQCFARNDAGETAKSTWLKVNSSPPELLTPPSDVSIVEGGDARFPCETRGAPLPTVTWSKVDSNGDVTQVTTGGRFQILDRGELLVASAIPSDSGLYVCNASNSKGSINASASLTVLVRTQISRPPWDQTIIFGSTATFPCGVSHDPEIVITWQWIHKSPYTNVNTVLVPDGRLVIEADGTLRITGVFNQDIGNYTCNVISSGGNDTRTVSLKVIELPGTPAITNVTLHPTDVRGVIVFWSPGYDGNSPILRYSIQYKEVSNAPDPGDDISSGWVTYDSPDISADDRQATVSRLRPARLYQFKVFASNEVGEGQGSEPKPVPPLEMPQQPPSSPPKGLFGSLFTNNSVTLGWQPPDEDTWNGPLLGYTIQYKPAGYPNTTFQRVNVTNLSVSPRHKLTGLSFFQLYEVQIAAYNIEGVGVYSSLIRVKTLEGRPTAPPSNLVLEAVSSTSIKVSWRPPDGQFINGINQGYKLFARRLNFTQPEIAAVVQQDETNPTGTQSTVLDNLHKYTNYSITVLCYTSQGDGPQTMASTIRTLEDVPSEVGSLTFSDIFSTSLKVAWTPPTEINGVLQGYTLLYERKNQSETRQTVVLPSTNLTYTISSLNPMTKYTIYVFAFTQKGNGPSKSADIESGVPPELPKAPFDLGVTNPQARSVHLQFFPGYDGKTSITLWIVEALVGKSATQYKTIFQKSDPNARSMTVENLQPYTYYKLRLIAENIVGRSNASNATAWVQTLQDAPANPPGNVTVRALNATDLRVSWRPLLTSEWNGNPRGYKIYYRMKGDNSTSFTLVDLDNGINMDSAILNNLEEWMEYEVKMLAYNEVGVSPFSPITVQRTRESVPTLGPKDVTANSLTPTSIEVKWGEVPKLQQNGMILGYKVQYRSDNEGIRAEYLDVPGNTTQNVNVTGLRKFVEYQIRVLAYTRMGDGALSVPEVNEETLPDVPGPPVSIWFPDVSYSQATIAWEEPTEPNGIITGYMVSYRVRDSGDILINSTVLTPAQKTYSVNGLQRQVHYEFRVVASTTRGWGETAIVEVFTMTNRNIPDSPSKPTIQASMVQARSVTISWIAPQFNGYGPLRNYTVQYKTITTQWTSVQDTIMPFFTRYEVTGLSPNTVYTFRVAATNDIGTSEYSVQSDSQKTLEDYPEGAPRFVQVKPLTPTSVKVTWEQPLPMTWNGDLLGYILMYRQEGTDSFLEETIPIEIMEKELTQLVKYINYEFLMKAFNSVGSGPASTPVMVYVGEAAPTAAPLDISTNATNSTEILVTWSPPPLETQNGALSGYKIFYWKSSLPESTANQIIVREETVLLKDLEIYTRYSITVQAYNLAGEGPKSQVVQNRTLEGLPEKPNNLSFWNITYTSMDVSWTRPSKPNGEIISYDLSYEESSGGNLKIVKFNISGQYTSKHITDLVPDTTYLFFVSARTRVGKGLNLNQSTVTGPQFGSPGRPAPPIVSLKVQEQMVVLVWKNGDPGLSSIYLHKVESKTEDSNTWKEILQIQGNATEAEIALTKLNPDNEYRFRVYAMNTYGISRYSEPSSIFRTPKPEILQPEEPFHYQPWFLVICALGGLIVILVIISLLCLVSRKGQSKHKKASNSTSMSNLAPSTEPEDGGFSNFQPETRQSTHSRRTNNKFAGIRNGNANGIYARSPPRPSPASVAYSDDDGASIAKAPLPDDDDDDDSSSCTEKPSVAGDSTEPSEPESDDDSMDAPFPPPPPPPSSPPPPPFSLSNNRHNNYHDPPPITNNWQPPQNNSSFNAYQYTDSEAESSHYAYSLNGGQIMLNNTAGSRAPLPGFSSFV